MTISQPTVDRMIADLEETLRDLYNVYARVDGEARAAMEKLAEESGCVVSVAIKDTDELNERLDWIRANHTSKWDNVGQWFWFDHEADAAAFLLRWS